jgi:hypothetical protein
MDRDAILAELLEIEGMLLDARLSDEDRHALHGAAQALRHVPDAATWPTGLARRSIAWVTASARLDRHWSADHSTPRRPCTVGS